MIPLRRSDQGRRPLLLQAFPKVLPPGTLGWRGQPGGTIHQPQARGLEIKKVELALWWARLNRL